MSVSDCNDVTIAALPHIQSLLQPQGAAGVPGAKGQYSSAPAPQVIPQVIPQSVIPANTGGQTLPTIHAVGPQPLGNTTNTQLSSTNRIVVYPGALNPSTLTRRVGL